MNKSRLLYSIGSAILILLIGITFLGMTVVSKTKPSSNAADANIVTIVKNSTVTVYINGYGVTKLDETANEITYEVAPNNRIALRVVNESKIFTSWNFSKPITEITDDATAVDGSTFDLTSPYLAFRPKTSFTIDTVRRDPLTTDYGRYMQNAYLIDTGSDLKKFSEMYVAGNVAANITDQVIAYYDEFFKEDPEYSAITGTDNKRQAIVDTFFNKLQWGHFNVTTSFGMFEDDYFGMGNVTFPFRGVFGGYNGTDISNIFVNTICNEQEGDNYVGLFGVLEEEAVVRNLNITTSIAFIEGAKVAANIYAGGLSGWIKAGFLSNINITTKFALDEIKSANITAGGIAGKMTGATKFLRFGINNYHNVNVKLNGCEWLIETHTPGKSIMAGGIVGYAEDTYIRGIDIDVTDFHVKAQSISSNAYKNEKNEISNTYIGNICGYYRTTIESPGMPVTAEIKNIRIYGTEAQDLTALISSGNAYVGGIIGYIDAVHERGFLGIGEIDFAIKNGNSKILAQSLDYNSEANLYTGGLIAKMSEQSIGKIFALADFKENVEILEIDGEQKQIFEAIFEANYEIKSLQNGKEDGTNFGASVAGGLVGSGYIDMNGTAADKTTIIITRPAHSFTVSAIQSITTTTTQRMGSGIVKSSKEHATAGLVYGLFSLSNHNIKISEVDYFAENFALAATREMGSTSGGDVHAGGIVGYSYGADFENIRCYWNTGSIRANSYSYDCEWTNRDYTYETNNLYLGGLIGEFTGQNGKAAQITNCILKGFDYEKNEAIGTNIVIASVQNTPPPGEDYSAENYTGGIIGRVFRGNVDGLQYIGSTGTDDYINMQSEQNPDTSFCGGIIGYIRNNDGTDSLTAITTTVKNCLVQNATIRATTTTIQKIGSTNICDMYTGGIIGACFNGAAGGSKLEIEGCHIHNTNVSAIGNEIQVVYAAGIIGINTWVGTTTIKNCHVADSNINAYAYYSTVASDDTNTYAAGIIGETNTYAEVQNCGVFDTNILSYNENPGVTKVNKAVAAGFVAVTQRKASITRGYSRARLQAQRKNNTRTQTIQYGIAPDNNPNEDRPNYYIKELAGVDSSNHDSFKQLSTAAITIAGEGEVFTAMADPDRYRNKFYPTLIDGNFQINGLGADNTRVTISKIKDNVTDVLKVWVNVNEGGENVNPHDVYHSDLERNEHGWFLFAEVLLRTGTVDAGSESMAVSEITYHRDEHIYEYKDGKFVDRNYPYESVTSIGYREDRTTKNIIIGGIERNIITSMDIKIHNRIPILKMTMRIINANENLNYYPIFFYAEKDSEGNIIGNIETITNFASMGYGTYELVKSKGTDASGTSYIDYNFSFSPNLNLTENHTFFLGFRYGSTGNYSKNVIEFDLVANKRELSGFTYADYTEPINSYETTGLGTETNPYLIRPNYTLKLIPIFTRSNDQLVNGEKPKYTSVANNQYVTYSLDGTGQDYGTIKADGELKCNDKVMANNVVGKITMTLLNDPSQKQEIYFRTMNVVEVSYSTTGSTSSGLIWTSPDNDYAFDMTIDYGYNGKPKWFNVTIDDTLSPTRITKTYNMDEVAGNGWLRDKANNPISTWDEDAEGYILVIPKDVIKGNIAIDAEFTPVYIITFNSQAESFNDKITDANNTIEYKVPAGTLFNSFFSTDFLNNELYPWVREQGIFGFVFMGFYLVDNANSIVSYGLSFKEIIETMNLKIATSYTFYARWSFLIEIIDAPGTHIKTSFSPDFLNQYGVDAAGQELSKEELENLGITRALTIPINNNQGYAFTVEKDDDFIGKANVQAFICNMVGNTKTLTEIDVEKYYEDMYLYRIPSEVITGYLVICTSVSNSELIVGENTSQVTDSIMPEDGVYTFKYIANHFNKVNHTISYIYDSGIEGDPNHNLELYRNVLLKFYQETYNQTSHEITKVEKTIPKGTVFEVYYHQYVNGVKAEGETVVGTYITEEPITQILLSDFLKLNSSAKAFENIKFKDLLSGTESLSEVFYFVITPPNGYTEYEEGANGSVINNYVYVGYYDETRDDKFVQGARADYDLVNIPLKEQLGSFVTYESSCHIRSYSALPSRQTTLTKTEGKTDEFTFKDKKYYNIFDLKLTKGTMLTDGTIVLTDDTAATNTIIESDIINDGIMKLTLSLGYNQGNVEIYGKGETGDWELIKIVNVNNYDYTNYLVDFDASKNYRYFRIDNVSLKEIRLNSIAVTTIKYAMTYEFKGSDLLSAKKTTTGDVITIKMEKLIIGDMRHDGKHFIMAIQFKDTNGIIENIDFENVKLSINGTRYSSIHQVKDSAVIYFDLTDIANTLNTDEMIFTIEYPAGYKISTVLLLEATTAQKPGMAEVRYLYQF